MRNTIIGAVLLVACLACVHAEGPKHRYLTSSGRSRARQLWSNATAPFTWKGGPVMTNEVSVYYIYIGYQETDHIPEWINYFTKHLQDTDWWRAMTRYYKEDKNEDGTTTKVHYNGKLKLADAWYYPSLDALGITTEASHETEDQVIKEIVQNALKQKQRTALIDDFYLVVTKEGIARPTECGGASSFGWHNDYKLDEGYSVKYGFVPYDPCLSFAKGNLRNKMSPVGYKPAYSPTSDPTLDSVISTICHEFIETVSDPADGGWYGKDVKEENADVCNDYYVYPLHAANLKIHKSELTGSGTGSFSKHIQYTDMVGQWGFILPLTYDPSINPTTGEQWGCVLGVDKHGVTIPAHRVEFNGEDEKPAYDEETKPFGTRRALRQ